MRTQSKRKTAGKPNRRGAALLFALFVIAFMTLMAVNVLDTTTLQTSALRNTLDYERALFLANAGVHAAAAQLEATSTWTGTITDGSYPADDTFQAVATTATATSVSVVSIGVAGEVTRTVQAIIEL